MASEISSNDIMNIMASKISSNSSTSNKAVVLGCNYVRYCNYSIRIHAEVVTMYGTVTIV